MCDAVFVYKESNIHEILLDNSPVSSNYFSSFVIHQNTETLPPSPRQIHCESYMMNEENIVSVILQDTSGLVVGDSYRFCLVLLQQKNIKRDLVVGCSNITKLEAFENASDDTTTDDNVRLTTERNQSEINAATSDSRARSNTFLFDQRSAAENESLLNGQSPTSSYKLLGSVNGSFLPGLAVGIFITSLFVLIWGATKLRNERHHGTTGNSHPSSMTTCYMASNSDPTSLIINVPETDNRNQYLKLQATTNL